MGLREAIEVPGKDVVRNVQHGLGCELDAAFGGPMGAEVGKERLPWDRRQRFQSPDGLIELLQALFDDARLQGHAADRRLARY